jgi:hypothetical protein
MDELLTAALSAVQAVHVDPQDRRAKDNMGQLQRALFALNLALDTLNLERVS